MEAAAEAMDQEMLDKAYTLLYPYIKFLKKNNLNVSKRRRRGNTDCQVIHHHSSDDESVSKEIV